MGERLQRFRKLAGLSQAQMARAAHVPVGTLKNWEQNLRVPSLEHAVQMAKTLRMSLDDLVGINEDPPVQFLKRRGKK
jgi:transcriptional regulator with XRE-family HTH domain